MLIVNVLLRLKYVHKSGAKIDILFEMDNNFQQIQFKHNTLKIKSEQYNT